MGVKIVETLKLISVSKSGSGTGKKNLRITLPAEFCQYLEIDENTMLEAKLDRYSNKIVLAKSKVNKENK